MPKYVAAIDQGTTSTRCMIFDQSGSPVGADQLEHDQIYPQPGWVEHDPLEIWARAQAVMHGALRTPGVGPDALAAIGITNQRETTVVWNRKTGQPYDNAIVWQDTRTDKICSGAGAGRWAGSLPGADRPAAGDLFLRPEDRVDPGQRAGSSADAADRGEALFGNIDTWLIWNLTGGPNGGAHVTDVTNASRTLLMNLRTLDWDDECLAALGIPRQMLPAIRPSSDPEFYGYALGKRARLRRPGRPAGGAGRADLLRRRRGEEHLRHRLLHAAEHRHAGRPKQARPADHRGATSWATNRRSTRWKARSPSPARWCNGCATTWASLISRSMIEDYARQVPDSGGIYFVPAFSGLFAPYWQSDARGVIVGLTRFINKSHMCRAALEATAYQTREVLDAMEQDSGVQLTALKVDGGMVYNQTC